MMTTWKEGSVCAAKKENADVGTKKSKKSNHTNNVPLDHHRRNGTAGDMSVLEDNEHGTNTTVSSSKQKQLMADNTGRGGSSNAKE
eukprot:8737032-Ditylum_brightwellii.AAC.1